MKTKAAVFALAASFTVYLIPLVGPHAAWLLGHELFHGEPNQSLRWLAVNWAVAVAAQLVVFGSFYWFFRKPRWSRFVPLLLAFPALFLGLELLYLVVIPTVFLEERDTARENTSWPIACTVPGINQTELQT